MDHVKSYRLWHDGSVRSVRSNFIMLNCIDCYMMNKIVQLGQDVSWQIISIMTWFASQVSQVKLDNVKSYWLWHDESVGSVRSSCIMSNHIDYEMMDQSGQSGKILSCQIISIMTWCISHFSQIKLDNFKPYQSWHYVSVRSVRSSRIM